MPEKKVKRKKARYASVYFVDQIEKLDEIATAKDVSRADLLREGADIVIDKYKTDE